MNFMLARLEHATLRPPFRSIPLPDSVRRRLRGDVTSGDMAAGVRNAARHNA